MIHFYFLSNNTLLLLFVLAGATTGLQAAYVWIIAYNNFRKRFFDFLYEFLLMLYVFLLARSPIYAMVNRHTSILYSDSAISFKYVVVILLSLCFFYLIIKKRYYYAIPLIGIIITLPDLFAFYFYAYLYTMVLCVFLARALRAVIVEQKRKRTDVSAFTIKNVMDTLSAGVLFSGVDGHIFLVNTCMLELMERFFEREQMNAKLFWDLLINGNAQNAETQLLLTTVLLRTSTDTWCFMRRTFDEKNKTYVEIIATDITETDRTFLTLENDTKKLLEQNEEIKILTENMVQLRKEQEFSRLRNQIHDVMGQRLTAIQRMLQSQQPEDYKEIIPLLQNIVENIREEKSKDMSVMLLDLQLYFKKIGIHIFVEGILPEDESIAYLFITTLREATTNAVRHAKATEILAQIFEDKNRYTFSVSNNGKHPKIQGTEGGGLTGIRNRVETSGGNFVVEWLPKFKLSIEIHKEGSVQ